LTARVLSQPRWMNGGERDGEPVATGASTSLAVGAVRRSDDAPAACAPAGWEHARMSGFGDARWYAVRPAANRKPATYRCPFCGELLPALSAHRLVVPEGDASRRRHAHTDCVLHARRDGRLPLRDEVEARRPSLLARLLGRG
jgi:hypothetical protein